MNIKTMQRVMLMFGLTFLCCSHTLASDDMNGFIAEGNSLGYASFWNWKSTADGGWKHIAAWMIEEGDVVWEGEFDTGGQTIITTPVPHMPFHDWSGQHGLSSGSGNWSIPSCFMFQVCGGGGGSWDPH